MANNKNFIAKNGVSTGDGYAMPDVRPSLLLDFANSKTLDPRITFTRGSTATYWDGKTTTKAEENLIPYSDFSSGWTDEGKSTITLNNDTAPDGTTTAARLFGVNGAVMAYFYDQLPISNSGKLTGSIYIKEAGQRYAYVQVIAGNTSVRQSILFDLNTGTQVDSAAQGSPTGVSYSITSVGNSWYRCVVTMDQSGSSNGYLLVGMAQSASPSWNSNAVAQGTFTTSDTIIIWGAQLEERDSVTAYTATTSQPIVKYQPTLQTAASGEARFDHDPVTGESKGLLIEESRTNEADAGQDFTNASWVKSNLSVTGNVSVAPNGSQVADLAIPTTTTASHQLYDSTGFSANLAVTSSVYAKLYGNTVYQLRLNMSDNSTGNAYAVFNLVNETAGSLSSSGSWSDLSAQIENVGNGWYRCSLTATKGTGTVILDGIDFLDTSGAGSFAGDGFSGLLLWGKQLELGAFPTSYIPTSGSTVTRSNDYAKITGTNFDFFNNTEGTIFAAYEKQAIYPSDSRFLVFSDTENVYTTNSVFIRGNDAPASDGVQSYAYSTVSGSTFVNNSDYSVSTAASYEVNSINAAVNGTLASEVTSAPLPNDISLMYIISSLCGFWFSKIAYYPKKLSNATLQQMTEE